VWLWSSATTSPRRCRVRKPVPQATSSVRPGSSEATTSTSRSSSSFQPGRSRLSNSPLPRYQSSYSRARRAEDSRLCCPGAAWRRAPPDARGSRAPVGVANLERLSLTHAPRVRGVLPLESVPNFSEGRDRSTIDAIGAALESHARVLDVHSDEDHHRSVFTLVGAEAELVEALAAAGEGARGRTDLRRPDRAHPRVG